MAVVMAPMIMQQTARETFGMAPGSAEFEELYGEQLRWPLSGSAAQRAGRVSASTRDRQE